MVTLMPPILHFAIETVALVITFLAFVFAAFIGAEVFRDEHTDTRTDVDGGDQW